MTAVGQCHRCGVDLVEGDEDALVAFEQHPAPTFGDNHGRADGLRRLFHRECYPDGRRYRLARDDE